MAGVEQASRFLSGCHMSSAAGHHLNIPRKGNFTTHHLPPGPFRHRELEESGSWLAAAHGMAQQGHGGAPDSRACEGLPSTPIVPRRPPALAPGPHRRKVPASTRGHGTFTGGQAAS